MKNAWIRINKRAIIYLIKPLVSSTFDYKLLKKWTIIIIIIINSVDINQLRTTKHHVWQSWIIWMTQYPNRIHLEEVHHYLWKFKKASIMPTFHRMYEFICFHRKEWFSWYKQELLEMVGDYIQLNPVVQYLRKVNRLSHVEDI